MNRNDIFASGLRNLNVDVDSDIVRFFFFGCWNKNLIATTDIISEINIENKCTFGIVCGDNVYPDKVLDESGNEIKVAKFENIVDGFNVLKRFNGNVYIGLGNHEVDTTEKCKALLYQKSQEGGNIVFPNNYYSINVNNNQTKSLLVKIIILDTNILEENTCYGKHNEIDEVEMLDWFYRELESCEYDTIPIVIGHYPLFYFKSDKSENYKFQIGYTMEKIYNALLAYARPIYYLCADIHNYQHIISDNITQHIVGTGGAEQDKLIEVDMIFQHTYESKIYNIVKCTQKYGYLYVDIENNILTTEFKPSTVPVEVKLKKNKKKQISLEPPAVI